MIKNIVGYSYNDLTIVPSIISEVSSRSECNTFIKGKFLPIFTAPMASVVNFENYETFLDNGITPIIPRNISLEVRKDLMNDQQWVALSLKEFEDLFIDNYVDRISDKQKHYHICVDIANGHMQSLYEKCYTAKKNAIAGKYELTIMTGNIANPESYKWICEFNKLHNSVIDYIRIGIGGGSGCFVDGTKIITKNGLKNIEDINEGELVLTIDGSYQRVINTTRFKSNELIKINNEVTSTINHKFFVINKKDKNKVNENNLQKYGYWLEANKLDKEKHLLIKIGLDKKLIKFVEIESIEYINDLQWVNDLSVENNHNYIANEYLVHNCITTSNVSIHYPQASLIDECYQVKCSLLTMHDHLGEMKYKNEMLPKIVADGGIRNYDHVIKALALGADYVMIGSVFAQCIESAGEKTNKNINQKTSLRFPIERYRDFEVDSKDDWRAYYTDKAIENLSKEWKNEYDNAKNEYKYFKTDSYKSEEYKNNDIKFKAIAANYFDRIKSLKEKKFIGHIDVKFFGMASADGQKSISGEKTKTAEGITKWLPVKYTLSGWVENMISYLRSAMSYTDCKTLEEFIGKPDLIVNSISEIQAVNK